MLRRTTALTITAATVALTGAVAAPGAAAAKACQRPMKNPLIPHLVTPCDGATIKRGSNPTFTAYDGNVKTAKYRPYIILQSSRRLIDGRLPPNTDGRGLFAQMKPVAGHKGRWSFKPRHFGFATYWENHPGTYYVQIEQIDGRAGRDGIFCSRIVTLHVR